MAFPFKTKPDPIQKTALKRAWKEPTFGLFHAMGAGKTWTTINLAGARFLRDQIKWLIVVCPNAVKAVWGVELDKHSPVGYDFYVHKSGDKRGIPAFEKRQEGDKLAVMSFAIESFSQGGTKDLLLDFMKKHEDDGIMMVIDESSKIKTYSAGRTKIMLKAAKLCQFRVILTGTPISQGYQDLFSQMYFLDPDIIGLKSFMLYKNMYCIMGGFEGRKVIGFQNQDKLYEKIAPYVDVVTKEQAMPDLRPKIYMADIEVDLTNEQKKAMKQLEDLMQAEMSGDTLTIRTVMDKLTRYQQICGGNFPFDEDEGYGIRPIEGKNPKLIAMMDLCETIHEAGEKVVIWARFKPEHKAIEDALAKRFGPESVVGFHGDVAEDERPKNTKRFETDDSCRFIVANVTVGGMGQTWVAGTSTIYYSNTFSYEDRMQSEDRNHRRGQKNVVKYYNIVAKVRADKMITQALMKKHDVAVEFREGTMAIDLGGVT